MRSSTPGSPTACPRCARTPSAPATRCRGARWCCWSDPTRQANLERMRERLVARIDADAVVESPRQARFELQRVTLFTGINPSRGSELVAVLQRRVVAAAREQQLHAHAG